MVPAQLTGSGGKLTFTVSKTNIGSYSFRIKYWSTVNSAKVEGAFVVDVYPESDYTHPEPTTQCVADIYPATFGNFHGKHAQAPFMQRMAFYQFMA